ncbi:MAG: hypothetical protein GZ094_20890, partial [Mariniphaga sp.]|nr:hypothetical protein [Mariniphaga sp.]
TVCQGQGSVVYSVSAITNATGYTWTLPAGASITSGNNTSSITVAYSTSAVNGNITVLGTNACGSGAVSASYPVTVNPLPLAAGTITGTSTVCQGQSGVVYSIPAITNATGYTWTLPTGATITSGNNTSSITVAYSTSAVTGNITVLGTNVCGSGAVSANYTVTVNQIVPRALSANMNYIQSRTILKENVLSETAIESLTPDDLQETITYFDGLGRPRQTVSWQASPTKKDMVIPVGYDNFGRQDTTYLPYAMTTANNGAFVTSDKLESRWTNSYGSAEDGFAFAITKFEPSPLNRVLKQGAPGAAWQPDQHPVSFDYQTNNATDVKLWQIDASNNCVLSSLNSGYYNANELYLNKSTDENLNPVKEYKDKEGRVVLKSAYDGTNWLNTYYIYDDFGLLRFVLPPKLNANLGVIATLAQSSDLVKQLGYYYQYDDRHRMVVKQLPGADPVYMVYDQRDRLVASQDAVMRSSGRWMITKYDCMNRPVMTAAKVLGDTREILKSYFDNYQGTYFETRIASVTGYTPGDSFGDKLSLTESDLLSVTYYDTYDYPGKKDFDSSVKISSYYNNTTGLSYFNFTKGQVTGSRVKVLDGTENNSSGFRWLVTTNYYDDRYRVVQTLKDLYATDATYYEVASTLYDFPGKIIQTKQSQIFNSVATVVDKYYTYDHAGRLTTTEQQITGDATNGRVTVALNSYNEIGQIINKKLHKANTYDYVQSVGYTYNIRGWLTKINDPDNLETNLFGMKLLYNEPDNLNNTTQFNGNISAMVWNTAGKTKQGYLFAYDGINRLNSGDHKSFTTAWTDDNNYEEKSIAYDANGNINTLVRTNPTGGNIANFNYTYSGNQLSTITGGLAAYTYDANGNTTIDGLRNITVAYNILNLPKSIAKATDKIDYIYSAAGEKLAKKMKEGTYQYYAGNMVYDNAKSLKYLLFDEGLVNKSSGVYSYEYHLKDHLGNTRVAFQPNGSGTTTTQVAEYYPFGSSYLPISPAGTNKYLYNGKEKQDDVLGGTALDWYDYGARFYDPTGVHWITPDPKAEKYYNVSPYVYCLNNPIKFVDPDGNEIRLIIRGESRQQDRQLIYKGGSAFWKDTNKKYDGQGGNNTIDRTLQAYQKIEKSDDSKLKNQLHTLEKSDKLHWIEEGASSGVIKTQDEVGVSKLGDKMGTQTTLNFSEAEKKRFKEIEGIENSDLSIVVHELRHQYDYNIGNMKDAAEESDEKDPSEIRAVNNENRVNPQKRTTYGGKKIDPKKLENPPNDY